MRRLMLLLLLFGILSVGPAGCTATVSAGTDTEEVETDEEETEAIEPSSLSWKIPFLAHGAPGHFHLVDVPFVDGLRVETNGGLHDLDILRVAFLHLLRYQDTGSGGRLTVVHWPLQFEWDR